MAGKLHTLPFIRWLLPPKKHPEDNHPIFTVVVRIMVTFWLVCAVWSLCCLWQWAATARYRPARAVVLHGGLEYVVSRVSSFSYEYTVDGQRYVSAGVMIGGRNLGSVPDEGEIQIWYDPKDPADAVIYRQMTEPVWGAIVAALLLPFAIRKTWLTYV